MAQIARVIGYVLVVLAALLTLVGLSVWPPGGLMFALPFVFLMPAALLWLFGLMFLWYARRAGRRVPQPAVPPDGEGGI